MMNTESPRGVNAEQSVVWSSSNAYICKLLGAKCKAGLGSLAEAFSEFLAVFTDLGIQD